MGSETVSNKMAELSCLWSSLKAHTPQHQEKKEQVFGMALMMRTLVFKKEKKKRKKKSGWIAVKTPAHSRKKEYIWLEIYLYWKLLHMSIDSLILFETLGESNNCKSGYFKGVVSHILQG